MLHGVVEFCLDNLIHSQFNFNKPTPIFELVSLWLKKKTVLRFKICLQETEN